MDTLVAALPMYDWPEVRAEIDARWELVRGRLDREGIPAPRTLARRNCDLPAVVGGIRSFSGEIIAPDPATLEADGLDLAVLWRHPCLILSQTCWGPMLRTGLADQVRLVAQPDYSAVPGGRGPLYSSAIVMRRGEGLSRDPPAGDSASIPFERLRGLRLAYNEKHSMSGFIALSGDLSSSGLSMPAFFGSTIATGGHRASIRAVAEGRVDVAAIDCRSWQLARRFEPAARELHAVGWTRRSKGLPFICARRFDRHLPVLREAAAVLAL